MRRKSTRNTQKATPDKPVKESETTPKTRRSRRRKRSPSKTSSSEDEVLTVTKRAPLEETPDTTTKSHTPSDEEVTTEPVWQVTPQIQESPKGEIQKLKICLTRPSPDSPDKQRTRSKSNSQTEDDATSSEDKSSKRTRSHGPPIVKNDSHSQEGDEDGEDKKGKGKSKGKHKSNREKSSNLSEPEPQTNNEISENAQVTPQSPSIDKPVDNENDDYKDKQSVNESAQEETANLTKNNSENQESDDDEPLSVIKKQSHETEEVITTPEPKVEEVSVVAPDNTQSIQNIDEQQNVEEVTEEKIEPISTSEEQDTDQTLELSTKDTEFKEIEEQSSENTLELSSKDVEMKEIEEQSSETTLELSSKDVEMKEIEEQCSDDNKIVEKINQDDQPNEENENLTATTKIDDSIQESDKCLSKTIEVEPEEPKSKPKANIVRPKLIRNNVYVSNENEDTAEQSSIHPSQIKRKWESDLSSLNKMDLDTIQSVCPEIDFPEEPDLHLKIETERRKSLAENSVKKPERKVSVEYKSDSEKPPLEKQSSISSTTSDNEHNANIIAFNRKISIVDDTASKLRPPPSPAKNSVSNILYITNLVRPFTVKQLRGLLERTGKIEEDGFWTDKIKSKCYVKYESQDEAEATRNAIHGVQWPIGNGKNLIIDYATDEDMELAKNPPSAEPVALPSPTKENVEPSENPLRSEERIVKEYEKKRSEGPVREWDIGKKDVRQERSRSREKSRKHRRTPSPHDDFITRKHRKTEEFAPQKLMDDLFLKTKATPSIYWQALSPEEIAMKQQQRLIRMEEHKRRLEESSRVKGRDTGRGAFRRRYD